VERLDPGNETVHYYTVLCNWKLDTDASRLLPVVQEAVRKFGPDQYLLNALADTYRRCGYDDLAEKWFRKLIGINPDELTAYEGLIDLFEEGKSTGSMDEIFDRYLSLAPEDQRRRRIYIHDLYQRSEYGKSIEKIEEYLSIRREVRTETELYFQRMRAICYRKTGEFETAAELYRRLLKETPEKEELLRPYIYCLEKSGRKERAADTAEQAVQYLSRPSASLCLIAGVLRFKEGKMESALAHFRRATSTDPKDWRGFYNIGEIYRRQGMDGFARRFLQQAETLRSGTAGYTANQ
jgi:tetratricopeptide (TPR) repeat protein